MPTETEGRGEKQRPASFKAGLRPRGDAVSAPGDDTPGEMTLLWRLTP